MSACPARSTNDHRQSAPARATPSGLGPRCPSEDGHRAGWSRQPTDAATQFKSFQAFVTTRKRALDEMKNVHGVDLTKPPGVGGNPSEPRFPLLIEYGKPMARGRIGDGAAEQLPHPGGAKTKSGLPAMIEVHARTVEAPSEISRVLTKIEWDGGRWRVVQHYPTTKDLDPVTRGYLAPANIYVRR